MQPQGVQGMAATNATNIVLVHGLWADGSSWSKVVPILENAGHRIIAVQLPLHSLADDCPIGEANTIWGGGSYLIR
jgi:pimeloyl-ACP methyl ester carboxylesterase